MQVRVNVRLIDLEDTDRLEGYKISDLIIFMDAVKKAGVTDADLAEFARNARNAYKYVDEENKRMLDHALASVVRKIDQRAALEEL